MTVSQTEAQQALQWARNGDMRAVEFILRALVNGDFIGDLTAAELAYIDGLTAGAASASKALVLDANKDISGIRNLGATGAVSFTGLSSLTGNVMATEAGTGITAGSGTVYASSVAIVGGIIRTSILIDLTGLNSKNTDGDIIGVDATANPCHIGQITAARNGTIFAGRITCHETPAGGDPNVNLYSAAEGTGVEDGAIGDLTETLLYDRSGDWAAGDDNVLSAWPAADEYLYLTQGDATGTDATYTAGRLAIELLGY